MKPTDFNVLQCANTAGDACRADAIALHLRLVRRAIEHWESIRPVEIPRTDNQLQRTNHALAEELASLKAEREHWRMSSVCREKDARIEELQKQLAAAWQAFHDSQDRWSRQVEYLKEQLEAASEGPMPPDPITPSEAPTPDLVLTRDDVDFWVLQDRALACRWAAGTKSRMAKARWAIFRNTDGREVVLKDQR